MPNANYIDEWHWLSVLLPAIYSLSDPNYHHTWRTKHTGCRGNDTEGREGLSRRRKKKTKKIKSWKDLMLVDITSLYYHHFMVPTKLIESVPPPCTESSLLLAGPPLLHFFFPETQHFTFATWLSQIHIGCNMHRWWNTFAQLHLQSSSCWQKPHNTCLPVGCVRVCLENVQDMWGQRPLKL